MYFFYLGIMGSVQNSSNDCDPLCKPEKQVCDVKYNNMKEHR